MQCSKHPSFYTILWKTKTLDGVHPAVSAPYEPEENALATLKARKRTQARKVDAKNKGEILFAKEKKQQQIRLQH